MTFKTMMNSLITFAMLIISNLAFTQAAYSSREIKFAGPPNVNGYQEVCHIRFTGKYGQCKNGRCSYLPDNLQEKFSQDVRLGMRCLAVDEGRVQGWAEFDRKSNKWELSYIDEEDRVQRQAVTKLYPIKAINSQGYVVTMDEFTGEESRRHRVMHFCILHPPKALCGDGDVMLLSEPENNLLPYVFEILKSIEFIDDDSVQPSSPSPVQEKSMP